MRYLGSIKVYMFEDTLMYVCVCVCVCACVRACMHGGAGIKT